MLIILIYIKINSIYLKKFKIISKTEEEIRNRKKRTMQ
jgi:hypothetical protein